MLYNQPLATRFGTDFIAELNSRQWDRLDVAVAWVRRSALDHLTPSLTTFLQDGHQARFVVGVDLLNTSKEGLEALIALEAEGDCKTYVFHNEAESVFHPKLYLFRQGNQGKLIVGSNNLTGAGLFQNTEAGLAISGRCSKDPIKAARLALKVWMDTSSRLVLRLSHALLVDLETNGYVISEQAIRARHKAQRTFRGKKKAGKKRLFGSVSVPKPKAPIGTTTVPKGTAAPHPRTGSTTPMTSGRSTITSQPAATGQVLLIRPRLARRTQAQIPLRALGFFQGQLHAKSIATGIDRPISFTFPARGSSTNPNTAKIELPEAAGMTNPMARFVHTKSGIEFEVWDETSPQGASIKNSLVAGLALLPAQTFLTVPSKPSSATWWRFI